MLEWLAEYLKGNVIGGAFAMVAVFLLLGIFSSRLSSRLNMPVLLLFLGVGIIFGAYPEAQFNIHTGSAVEFTNIIGTIAMAFILYSGGLETEMRNVRRIFVPGILLSTLGVFLTAAILTAAVHFLLGWSWYWSFLLSAVVSSTDAAAVFAILRGRCVALRGNLAPVLEFESGSNDPMAALLTIFTLQLLTDPGQTSLWNLAWVFPSKMLIGIGGGWLIGTLGGKLFNNAKFEYEGLYFVLSIALVTLSYGLTELFYGNGFMAAYCAGVTMGNVRYNYKRGQIRFTNGLAWLMQVAMFTVLGMLVTFSDLVTIPPTGVYTVVWVRGLLLAAALMFAARPLAVFLCLIKSQFSWKERILISWVGLRGAAPIVLATFPLAYKLQGNAAAGETAGMLFNLVFCMVIASVIIQGYTLMPLARLLKLDLPCQDKDRMPLELEDTGVLDSVMHEFDVDNHSPCLNRTLAEIKLPEGARVMLIRREGSFIMAKGSTTIQLNDGLLIMAERKIQHQLARDYFPGNDFFDN